MWIGVALSSALTALRTFYQHRRNRRFYANDYFILFALLCHILTAIVYQIAMPPMYELANVGAQIIQPPPTFVDDANLFLRLQFALDMMLWTTSWAVKFSLLFFFWRLFDSVDSPMRVFWYIMCAIAGSSYIACIVLQQFACDPIQNFFIIGRPEPPELILFAVKLYKRSLLIIFRHLSFKSSLPVFCWRGYCCRLSWYESLNPPPGNFQFL